MISVVNWKQNKNINVYNIIRIFIPEEEIAFTNKISSKGTSLEIKTLDHESIITLYKDGKIITSKIKKDKENIYSNNKLTINNLYQLLSEYYDYKSDYGTLTGIRPVKLVRKLINKGYNRQEIKDELEVKYYLNSKKIDHLYYIALKEIKLINQDKISLYINIPFCPSKCTYCNFVSYIKKDDEIDTYINYLMKDLKENINLINKYNLKVESIYIGGGTPSILNYNNIETLLKFINKNIKNFTEFTFEAGRTDTLNKEKIDLLKKYKVNRISINPQSFNQKTLDKLNRKQSLEDIGKFYILCKDRDISVNSDLILGLPGEDESDMINSIDRLIELEPDNITIHTLAIKKVSGIKKEDTSPYEDIISAYKYAEKRLFENNYLPYYLYRQKDILGNLDNIGYSKEGKESLYNINMIEESQNIISVGLGSVTKVLDNAKVHRIPYNKNLNEYYHKYNYVNQNKDEYISNIH